jgi:glycosyltransferase involved in cell wall biosynthesis
MKILYVVPFVPWPVRVRSFNLIPRLARKHKIHLVCASNGDPTPEQLEWVKRYCATATFLRHGRLQALRQCAAALTTELPLRIAYCRSERVQRDVRQLCIELEPDVVYVERWRALGFVPADLGLPVVCDPTDSMTLYNQRLMKAGAWWERAIAWEEYRKFRSYEGKLARRVNVSVFCSTLDLDCVKGQAANARFELVPNGVDCEQFFFKEPIEESQDLLVFTGNYTYRPNRHAVEYFMAHIFPRIRRNIPTATFVAVGNGAQKALARFRGEPGFTAVDFVPELRPYLAKATVAVAPLTVGSGVSNKLAEGFAVGTPVVATSLACGDLKVNNGQELLIADSAEAFSDSVVRLLTDPQLRNSLRARARRFVGDNYDWEVVVERMDRVLQTVTSTRPAAPARRVLAATGEL